MRLPEPAIRATSLAYRPLQWQVERREPLPSPSELGSGAERRSVREFTRPALSAISTLLWHSARRQESLASPAGFDLHLRPVPSAGAIHPVHILVEHPSEGTWTRYDPTTHALDHLAEQRGLLELRESSRAYIDPGPGTLVLFAAEPGLTEAKYGDAASLIWRDAGVLQGAIALLAPQAGMATCFLGLTGDRFLSGLGEQGQLIGVGTAILGGAA